MKLFLSLLALSMIATVHVVASDPNERSPELRWEDDDVELRIINFDQPVARERFKACEGDCNFLVNYDEWSILMRKDNYGNITNAQVLPRINDTNEVLFSIDLSDIIEDPLHIPLFQIGTEGFVVLQLESGSTVIVHAEGAENQPEQERFNRRGSLGQTQKSSLGGTSTEGTSGRDSSCSTRTAFKNHHCTTQTDSYFYAWTECDRTVCSKSDKHIDNNCVGNAVTVPFDAKNEFFRSSGYFVCID